MRSEWLGAAVMTFCVACTGSDPGPTQQQQTQDPNRLAGFDIPAPGDGQVQVVTPIIKDIAAGKDVTFCTYLDFKAEKTMDVTSYLGFESQGGHHTILYAVPDPAARKPANTHECTDADMYNVKYIGGGGTDATIKASLLPPGIVFRIPEGAQLMMVSHWINTTDHAIDGQAAYNLTVEDPNPQNQPGDLFTVVATNFKLPTGTGSVHTQCTLKDDLSFFVIGGHAHEWATHIQINHGAAAAKPEKVIYNQNWSKALVFDTPLNTYSKEQAYAMKKGDTFSVDCTYNNTTGAEIDFPKEMCVGFGYYFPATAEIDCVDGMWPGN